MSVTSPWGRAGSSVKSIKEDIQEWIQKQASRFLEQWNGAADKNPAFEVVKRLSDASQQLDIISPASVEALKVRSEGAVCVM